MKLRYKLKFQRNKLDYDEAQSYAKTDLAGIQEQTLYMIKTRMGLIIEDVKFKKFNNFEDFFNKYIDNK